MTSTDPPPSDAARFATGPTWDLYQELLDRSGRNEAWKSAAGWALTELRSVLGDGWLAAASVAEPRAGALSHLATCSSHVESMANVVEWALGLKFTAGLPEADAFRAELAGDVTRERLAHSGLQVRLATAALRLGWSAELEPADGPKRPADVELGSSAGRLRVETKVLWPSDDARAAREQSDAAMERIADLRFEHFVWIEGRLGRFPTEAELAELGDAVAIWAAGDHAPKRWERDAIKLRFMSMDSPGGSLSGPTVGGPTWNRLMWAMRKKAQRMGESGAQWLCVEVRSGMWRDTPWAGLSLEAKLAAVLPAVHGAFPKGPPPGVVLMSPVGLNQGRAPDEVVSLGAASGIRRRIEPQRVRETLIIPLGRESSVATGAWVELAHAESGWLEWALERAALPTLADILAE